MLKDGSKTQTIRGKRRGQAKPGDTVYLYYGMRTKFCTKVGEGICTDVYEVLITASGKIRHNGKMQPGLMLSQIKDGKLVRTKLTGNAADVFAWNDGFRPEGSSPTAAAGSFELMMRFWRQTHELPFFGDIIMWELK